MKKLLSLLLCLVLLFACLPVSAGAFSVVLSPQNLTVDGVSVQCEKYNIDGFNYFKLRDLAYLLMGTPAEFGVHYDPETNTVTITPGQPYEPDGSELKVGGDKSATAVPTAQSVWCQGTPLSGLEIYNLGGNNYFRLRDLGEVLDFEVDFDETSNTAVVLSGGPVQQPEKEKAQNAGQDDDWYDPAPDPDPEPSGIGGSPWEAGFVIGYLPSEPPRVQDDLYVYYNYDYIASHQEESTMIQVEHLDDVTEAVIAVLEDPYVTGHDVELLRLIYGQAKDRETMQTVGYGSIQPYLDAIAAVDSIDDLNALMTSADFPFDPYLEGVLDTADRKGETIVRLLPRMLFVDLTMDGAEYYDNRDDPASQYMLDYFLEYMEPDLIPGLMHFGLDEDQALAAMLQLLEFEAAYGQYADYYSRYAGLEFGQYAALITSEFVTPEELDELCSNLPILSMLASRGKGGASQYNIYPYEWLTALDALWTEENLEILKLRAVAEVLFETRYLRDPSETNAYFVAQGGTLTLTPEEFACYACDSFACSHLMAKVYVEYCLGPEAKGRITAMAQGLVDTYRDLVDETPWLNDASRAAVHEKLDEMALIVLEPANGWFDYSGLELSPDDSLMDNYLKLRKFRLDCESAMIGKDAIASTVWYTDSPMLIECYYEERCNAISVFPGFLNDLYYRDDIDDCELLASLGFVIAHEISHAFDFGGAQFNAWGQADAVFTEEALERFVARTEKLAEYFSTVEVVDGLTIDGPSVVAEAAADLTALQTALRFAEQTIDDFDYDTFYGYHARSWGFTCAEEEVEVYVYDVHPMSPYRINVNAQMMDQVYAAFDIKEGDGMYLAPEERVVIWGPGACDP